MILLVGAPAGTRWGGGTVTAAVPGCRASASGWDVGVTVAVCTDSPGLGRGALEAGAWLTRSSPGGAGGRGVRPAGSSSLRRGQRVAPALQCGGVMPPLAPSESSPPSSPGGSSANPRPTHQAGHSDSMILPLLPPRPSPVGTRGHLLASALSPAVPSRPQPWPSHTDPSHPGPTPSAPLTWGQLPSGQ